MRILCRLLPILLILPIMCSGCCTMIVTRLIGNYPVKFRTIEVGLDKHGNAVVTLDRYIGPMGRIGYDDQSDTRYRGRRYLVASQADLDAAISEAKNQHKSGDAAEPEQTTLFLDIKPRNKKILWRMYPNNAVSSCDDPSLPSFIDTQSLNQKLYPAVLKIQHDGELTEVHLKGDYLSGDYRTWWGKACQPLIVPAIAADVVTFPAFIVFALYATRNIGQ